jgi:hypothetical protein
MAAWFKESAEQEAARQIERQDRIDVARRAGAPVSSAMATDGIEMRVPLFPGYCGYCFTRI